jgi:sulfur relay (sulfurtransferase) DsrC/TusE family protein
MDAQHIDSEGYLIDPPLWNEALAEGFARQKNIE